MAKGTRRVLIARLVRFGPQANGENDFAVGALMLSN